VQRRPSQILIEGHLHTTYDMLLPLLTLGLTSTASSFLIIDAEPGLVVVEPGQLVQLSCTVDSDYEYCLWFSPHQQICDFEWKRSEDNITMQECPLNENHQKISFHGKYDDRQCGVSFIATEKDTGIWRCEVEEYVWGGARNSGRKVSATMTVTVQASTTSRPTPPSTTATTTSSTSTTTTTTSPVTTAAAAAAPNTTSVNTVNSEAEDGSGSQKTPEAVPRVDSDSSALESAGSGGATAGAVVVILLLLAAVLAGAVYYRRRRSKRPDSTAAVVYDREAKANKDTANMVVRNSNSSEVGIRDLHTADLENRNLHEFFPHSESFA